MLHSIHSHRIVHGILLLSQCLPAAFELGERLSHGSGLLGTKVEGLVLLLAVEFPQVFTLVVADDRKHTSNRLPDYLATVE